MNHTLQFCLQEKYMSANNILSILKTSTQTIPHYKYNIRRDTANLSYTYSPLIIIIIITHSFSIV